MRLRVASSLSNSWAKEPIEDRAALPERHWANRSLSTAEPVSAPPKWKLENGEQRSAPETLAQRTKMPEIAGQRPAPASLTRGNINDFHRPEKNQPRYRTAWLMRQSTANPSRSGNSLLLGKMQGHLEKMQSGANCNRAKTGPSSMACMGLSLL